jgi:RNA polymerase-binding transcription factor DksA
MERKIDIKKKGNTIEVVESGIPLNFQVNEKDNVSVGFRTTTDIYSPDGLQMVKDTLKEQRDKYLKSIEEADAQIKENGSRYTKREETRIKDYLRMIDQAMAYKSVENAKANKKNFVEAINKINAELRKIE